MADLTDAERYDDMLAQYSREIGLDWPMSLGKLIESHRQLQATIRQRSEAIRQEIKTARKHGYADGIAMATHGAYIATEKLRSMTLGEIAEFLRAQC